MTTTTIQPAQRPSAPHREPTVLAAESDLGPTRSERARARALGIVELVLAAIAFTIFGRTSEGDATMRLTSPGDRFHDSFPDLVLDASFVGYFVAVVLAVAAGIQLTRGFNRWQNAVLAGSTALFVGAFLAWAAAGASFSLVGMLHATLVRSAPIALGALAGIMCERAGVVNIAIEGMLLSGAFAAAVVGSLVNPYAGLVAAILIGALMAALLAVLAIRYVVDQIIVGVVINLFALGLTSFLTARVLTSNPDYNSAGVFGSWAIPLLSDIPFLGPILFDQNPFTYATGALVAVITWVLFRTRWGLRVRAVGEHPRAADTLGVDVWKTQYASVIVGGMIAGLGGAYFIMGSTGRFDENLTNGRGYIALAAMIFGRWHPVGALGAALVFGFADSLQQKLGLLQTGIPNEFLLMAPFLATILVVAGLAGGASAPAHDGIAYRKGDN